MLLSIFLLLLGHKHEKTVSILINSYFYIATICRNLYGGGGRDDDEK